MLGVIYLCLCLAVGKAAEDLTGKLWRPLTAKIPNPIWFRLTVWFTLGTLGVTWSVYLVSYLFRGQSQPLAYGNGIVLPVFSAAVLLVGYLARKNGGKNQKNPWVTDRSLFWKEAAFYAAVFCFIGWLMGYVFHSEEGILYTGYTVFSDFSPHTAMIRSFSWGNNFPTQYPYFGGEDVKYHFMFQFLTGNLEYLGIPMDTGFLVTGTVFFTGAAVMVCTAANRIFSRFFVGAGAVILLCFRSSFSFWRFAWEHIQSGDLLETLQTNTQFIGYTANEDWGLWNLNVYLNQRHLAFGLCALCVAALLYLPDLEEGCGGQKKGLSWVKGQWFSRDAWRWRKPGRAVLAGAVLGASVFWNGAVVIAALLILAGMGLFSQAKLDYALTAFITLALSWLQSSFFIRGKSMDFQFQFGFLSEDATVPGCLYYLLVLFGVFFPMLAAAAVRMNRLCRCLLLAFSLPLVFAFTVSLTPDIAVNHKYVMISVIFLGIFISWALGEIWSKKAAGKLLAAGLAVMLTITGMYDLAVIIKDNDKAHSIQISESDDVTLWLKEHTDSRDLVLTSQYSLTRVTVSGVMMYCGWPYYGWSAGYDTDSRTQKAIEIYREPDGERLRKLVKREEITYIIYEDGMEIEGNPCEETVIREVYPLAYTSADGTLRIYQTGESSRLQQGVKKG